MHVGFFFIHISRKQKKKIYCLSIYLFIRHTPSNEYYVPGSPQHAIKVKDKNKADSKKGIKVHSVSVLYSRKESEDKNSSCQFMV